MSLETLVEAIDHDTRTSLAAFVPEIVLSLTIVAMLLVRVVFVSTRRDAFWIALAGSLLAAGWSVADWSQGSVLVPEALGGEIFSGLLVYDPFTQFLRMLLCGFAVAFCIQTRITGVPDQEDAADLYALALGGLVGMLLMAQANHVLMVFIGVEMASVPAYVLVGLQKGERRASEAALKFSVYGAAAAGIMLYGMTLLVGALGTAHLPTMATQLAITLSEPALADRTGVLILGAVMTLVGLSFKLTAFPFHFWCPDAFAGATAEVGAYLSIASKAAAIALLVRLTLPLAEIDAARRFLIDLLGLMAITTMTFGNLAAYGQVNFKRLLAYSTIAHAGMMMLPVVAALATSGSTQHDALAALNIYLVVYLLMNLGAFTFVALLRNELGSERIADSAGLVRVVPGFVICVAVLMFSLIGLPPWAGFLAKLHVFWALASAQLWVLLVVAALNTVLSLVYYLHVVKTMTWNEPPAHRSASELGHRLSLLSSPGGVFLGVVCLPLATLIVFWEPLVQLARQAAWS